MQPIPEPSLAELGRTLDRIERDLGRRLDEMKTAFETAFEHAVTAEVYEAHRQAMADQIAGALDKVADLRSDFEDMRAELVEEKKETAACTSARSCRCSCWSPARRCSPRSGSSRRDATRG